MHLILIRSKFAHMKQNKNILLVLSLLATLLCSCGDDRSEEFYTATQENQWIYSKMKEVYLWSGAIGEMDQKTLFSTPKQFFKKLLHTSDNISFFSDEEVTASYGCKYKLVRDPLAISPSKMYALIEYVEPGSAAASAGLERGMWISEIEGNRITTSLANKLSSGDGLELSICSIEYDDATSAFYWQEQGDIYMPAAMEFTQTSIPVVTVIDEPSGKSGYILFNSFDNAGDIELFNDALSSLLAEEVNNLILDLRYNSSLSLPNAAAIAAAFIPADKQGEVFCSLQKELVTDAGNGNGETITIPASTTNASDKPLYIITTAETQGIATTLIKGIQVLRGTSDVWTVGKAAECVNLYTEKFTSPYSFEINPATAYIYDAAGEIASPSLPDFEIQGEAYYPIPPLGNNQEYMLYNICYLIATGTLPE